MSIAPAGRRLRRQSRRRRAGRLAPIRPRSRSRWWRISSAGGAAVNQICRDVDADLRVYELALEEPTADITAGAGDERRRMLRGAMAYGMKAVAAGHRSAGARRNGHRQYDGGGGDLSRALWRHGAGLGRAAAPASTMQGARPQDRRRGRGRRASQGRISAIRSRFCARLGGREIAAIVGAVLAARTRARAGAARRLCRRPRPPRCCRLLDPRALDHCLAAHRLGRAGPSACSQRLGKAPLLDLGMRLGEALGRDARDRASSRRRSPATTAWRPSPKPASPGRKSLERRRGRAPNPQTHRVPGLRRATLATCLRLWT